MLEVVEFLKQIPFCSEMGSRYLMAQVQVGDFTAMGVPCDTVALKTTSCLSFSAQEKRIFFAQVMAQQKWRWVKEVLLSAWGHEYIHPSTDNQVFKTSSSKHYGMGPQKKLRWIFKCLKVFKAVKSVVWFVGFVWDFFSQLKWGLGKQPSKSILLRKVLSWDLQKTKGADNPVSCLSKTYSWGFYDFDLGKHEVLFNASLQLLWVLSFELQCGWANSSSLGTQCFAILKLKCFVF